MENTTPKPNKKTICSVNFTRHNGDQFLEIKAVSEIENLFKSEKTETSEKYKNSKGQGLKFYALDPKLADYMNRYTSNSRAYRSRVVLDHYGTDLVDSDNGNFNVSVLRTVDLSKGIKVRVNDLVLDEQVQGWTREMAEFLKYLYHAFIEKTEIKAVINLEI